MKKIDKIFEHALVYSSLDYSIIKWWETPFLWVLWFIKGYTITSDNFKLYWVNFRGSKCLLKSKEL